MCEGNKSNLRFLFYLLLALLFASVAGALRAEEAGPAAYMPMYLISETELRSIEEYRNKSEAEKQAWLLQVQTLKTLAGSLRRESEILNCQLADQRELNRGLRQSFNEYEAGQLALISLKNGEIADLKQAAADKALESERYKGKAALRLAIIIALLAAIAGYAVFRVCRFFRLV